jgi:hypothetical protein
MLKTFAQIAKFFPNLVTLTFDERVTFNERVTFDERVTFVESSLTT